MSDWATKMKAAMQCSARFIGKTTKAAAQSTKYKLNEMSAMSKRRELISDLGEKVYALAQQSADLPEELKDIIAQINALDTNLEVLRADHAALKAAAAERAAVEKAERAAQKAAAKAEAVIAKNSEPVEVPESAPEEEVEAAAPVLDVSCDAAIEEGESKDDVPTLNV